MENIEVKKYMNPITFEAEMFANSLEELSKTYDKVDENLANSLEKVINAIEKFLDTSKDEILDTEMTKLVKCDISNISRLYHCTKCKMDLGKSPEKVSLHLVGACSSRHKKYEFSQNVNKTGYKKTSKNLTKKTIALLKTNYKEFYVENYKISEKLKCIPHYNLIENDLLSIITPLYPKEDVRTYTYGSRLAGTAWRMSDLDIFVDIGKTFHNFQNRADDESVNKLHAVAKALKKNRIIWRDLVIIDKARVPILRVTHVETLIECDLNFSHSLGVMNTKFLDYIFTMQPIARALCIFMKKWLCRTSLDMDFNAYAITMLVLFFLQNVDLCPSMEMLQENINLETAAFVGPWLCTFEMPTMGELGIPCENISKYPEYIEEFFLFYSGYDFQNSIICPYIGETIERTELDSEMPERYTKYVKEFPQYALKTNSAIVIQDPIQLNHNITKSITLAKLQLLSELISNSLQVFRD